MPSPLAPVAGPKRCRVVSPTRAWGASHAEETLVFGFFKRRREPPPPRALLQGRVRLGAREWQVHEERRQGPFPQLFVLTDPEAPGSAMHLRLPEADPALSLEEVEARAAEPTDRWFADAEKRRWEARLVFPDPPDRRLVKLICWDVGVYEGAWPFPGGLGLPGDEELRRLLEKLRSSG